MGCRKWLQSKNSFQKSLFPINFHKDICTCRWVRQILHEIGFIVNQTKNIWAFVSINRKAPKIDEIIKTKSYFSFFTTISIIFWVCRICGSKEENHFYWIGIIFRVKVSFGSATYIFPDARIVWCSILTRRVRNSLSYLNFITPELIILKWF